MIAIQADKISLTMKTVYQQITEKFLEQISESGDVSAKKVEALKPLFADGKKLKAEDLVKIFTSAEESEVK